MPQGWENILSMVLLFAVLYFVMLRPQMKAQKAHKELMGSLKVNDKVMTVGGIYGILTRVGDESVTVKIADNVKVEFAKSAIKTVKND